MNTTSKKRPRPVLRVARVPLHADTDRPWIVHTLGAWDERVMPRPPARMYKTHESAISFADQITKLYAVAYKREEHRQAAARATASLNDYGQVIYEAMSRFVEAMQPRPTKKDYALAGPSKGGPR